LRRRVSRQADLNLELLVDLAVQKKIDLFGSPFHGIHVEFGIGILDKYAAPFFGADHVAIGLGIYGAIL